MDKYEQKHDSISRRFKWFRNRKELSVYQCAQLITKAGYPLTPDKLLRIEKGVTPLKCWGFLVAYCKAVVKTPNEVMGLKGHR